MPLEVVVELQIRAISCPGVFLPDKQDVYLGVYLLNQYLETDCFPSVFPIMIQQSMRFEKVFENAIDPGAVAEILESFLTRFELIQLVSPAWEELACYEENTRDFLFPEPKLTPSLPGMYRQVLMKTFAGFPEEREKSRRPLSTSDGPRSPLNNVRMRPKDSKVESTQSWAPSPCSPRCFVQDQPTPPSLGNNFRISGESKPPFVVRHVDSAKPFGDNISELQPRKSSTKPKFSNLPFPGRRASSFDSFAANIKVIKEPDERIVLRKESPSPLDSSKFGKPSPSYGNQGDADFHREASFATYQPSRSSSPLLDQPLLRERFHLYSQSTWRKIHERVCGLLTTHRAQQHLNKEYTISETKYILERPSYPLKKYPVQEQRYF
ncbi:spermatogenesis associated 6-like protein isoform X5 [Prionailurus bengalensis]|uniref:spermatogenesis associated 6-like protein isoform X5 n=1 Tax=Prionailurus bengalensis TaxID=37029 RepID=UPI001CA95726|nr:spermatogenesis associated 6-like protein isoform X5 [Prionailurus bengalensis]